MSGLDDRSMRTIRDNEEKEREGWGRGSRWEGEQEWEELKAIGERGESGHWCPALYS